MGGMFQVFVFYACVLALAALMAALVLAGMRQVGRLLLRNLKPVALAALLPLAALLTDFARQVIRTGICLEFAKGCASRHTRLMCVVFRGTRLNWCLRMGQTAIGSILFFDLTRVLVT